MTSASVIVPSLSGDRVARLLRSLAKQTAEHQVLVVDNGSRDAAVSRACREHPAAEPLRLEENAGFSRAVNLAAGRAEGEAIVLVNDDSVCDAGFVEGIVGALDPAAGVVMAAGVMCDWREPDLIETAGIQVDRTLLGFDYLNGESLAVLDGDLDPPLGPSGGAAAYERAAFLELGGFDENLFAYWEDVDLALRLRRDGATCALAAQARGTHEYSATFGPGSSEKLFLTGFGRGYLLRKWNVLSGRRAGAVLARDLTLCAGQLLLARTAAGLKGRVRGYRATEPTEAYPEWLADVAPRRRNPAALGARLRRWRRVVAGSRGAA
jgi:N-acetylglucosaminyl-diphospho-decaprenol L-rhamnosyltransferase